MKLDIWHHLNRFGDKNRVLYDIYIYNNYYYYKNIIKNIRRKESDEGTKNMRKGGIENLSNLDIWQMRNKFGDKNI